MASINFSCSESMTYEDTFIRNALPLYSDVTASVLPSPNKNNEHISRGLDYWCARLTHIDDMRMHGHHGIAIADVNADGLEDVYVCDAGGLPTRLYLHQADGTVLDFHRNQRRIGWNRRLRRC